MNGFFKRTLFLTFMKTLCRIPRDLTRGILRKPRPVGGCKAAVERIPDSDEVARSAETSWRHSRRQNIEQLSENLKALAVTLTADEMVAISSPARGTRIVDLSTVRPGTRHKRVREQAAPGFRPPALGKHPESKPNYRCWAFVESSGAFIMGPVVIQAFGFGGCGSRRVAVNPSNPVPCIQR